MAQPRALGGIEVAARLGEGRLAQRERDDGHGRAEQAVSGKHDGIVHGEILGTRSAQVQRPRGKRCNKG